MNRLHRRFWPVMFGQGGFRLPYSVDFSTLSDGALPSKFTGATWAVVSGKAVNTPTLGGELVVNGNMESGSPPSSWTALSATLSAEADERPGGSGTKSLQVARNGGTANAYQIIGNKVASGEWVQYRVWHKRINAAQAYAQSHLYRRRKCSDRVLGLEMRFTQ